MSKQNLNLTTILGVQEIDDRAAENASGGAFLAVLNSNGFNINLPYQGSQSDTIFLDGVNPLTLRNLDANANQANAAGNTFGVEYRNGDTVVLRENVVGQGGVNAHRLTEARGLGATTARVYQYYEFCDC